MKKSNLLLAGGMVMAAIAFVTTATPAAMVVQENFDYPDGAVEGLAGGTGWTGAWGATTSETDPKSEFEVVSGEAIYKGYQGATQETNFQSRAFASTYTVDVNTTLVLTFDNIVNETQAGRGIGVNLTDSANAQSVFIGKQINEGTGPGGVHGAIGTGGADYAVLGGARGSASLTATFTSDGTDTFVTIADGANPDVMGTIAGTQFSFDGMDLAGYHRLTTTNGVDNISIDVTTIPEPSSWTLMGLAVVGLIRSRRGRVDAQA